MVGFKRLWIGWGMVGLLLAGCGDAPKAKEKTLADSTLAEVLVELHLLAARKAVIGDVTPAFRDSVLARYGMDSVMLVRRLETYARDPQALQRLYQMIRDRLLAEQYSSPLPQVDLRR
jgi:hypothetical protein